MTHRHAAVLLLGLALVAVGCGGNGSGDDPGDFADVPGIGRTRIDVPRPTSPASVGGPTKACAADGLPTAASDSVKARVAALRALGFFADRKGDTDAAIAKDVQADIDSAFGADSGSGGGSAPTGGMLDLMVAAADPDRVWWNDLEADVAPDNRVYEDTLDEWAAISKGAFAPTDIAETWASDTGPVTVTYQLDGSKQTLKPADLEDWIDPGILTAIDDQIADSGRRFELYRGFDQTAFVVALTADERATLEHDRGWCFE